MRKEWGEEQNQLVSVRVRGVSGLDQIGVSVLSLKGPYVSLLPSLMLWGALGKLGTSGAG